MQKALFLIQSAVDDGFFFPRITVATTSNQAKHHFMGDSKAITIKSDTLL